ncbi:MAG: RiPP maturation radical SAM C-methyltransferase, partial [Actinomycetes bacterium]
MDAAQPVARSARPSGGRVAAEAGTRAARPGGGDLPRCDLVLVTMPFQHVRFPSLAVGLLKAILAREGFACRAVYANLRFAERLGLDLALLGERQWNVSYLGDWLFQRALFPGAGVSAAELVRDYVRPGDVPAAELRRLEELAAAARLSAERFLDDLAAEIVADEPTAVGCTITVVQLTAALALLRRVKELAPQAVTLAGGPGCEAGPGRSIHEGFPFVDYVVSGDADELIAPLLRGITLRSAGLAGDGPPEGVYAPWHRAHGYPEPGKDGAWRARVASLAGLPTPDYDEYFETLAASPGLRDALVPGVSFETSRGCWWAEAEGACAFCGDCGSWPAYRRKPAAQALAEIAELRSRYGATRLVATDNVIDRSYFDGFLQDLAREPGAAVFYEVRPDLGKAQALSLRRAGVTYVQAGIESLHTPALKAIHKGVAAWQNLQCLRWARQYGLTLSWFFMTKIPGGEDEWDDAQAALVPLLTHLQPPNFVGVVRAERFNRYFREAAERGLRIRAKEPYLRLFAPVRAAAQGFTFHFEELGAQEELADPLDFLLRPGRGFLRRAVAAWRAAFADPATRPRLEWRAENGALCVVDTRLAAVAAEHCLTGLEKDLLLAADEAPREEALIARLAGPGAAPAALRAALGALEERLLVV